ncbi:MAG: hypothetical protein H7833_01580 [Magnetococcus sp. DMHC-1]|nr:hypothetical protein [Magnetococcales bacterium]
MLKLSVVSLIVTLAMISGCSKSEEKKDGNKSEAAASGVPAGAGTVTHKDGMTTVQIVPPGAGGKATVAPPVPPVAPSNKPAPAPAAPAAPPAAGKPVPGQPSPAASAADPKTMLQGPLTVTPSDPNKKTAGTMTIPQSGKVAEVIQTESYSYVRIETEGWPLWLATNRLNVKTGEMVHWGQYSVMRNFFSKSLNQTFPMLLMVGEILPGAGPVPSATSSSNQGKAHAVFQAGGYTYIQVDSDKGPWLAVPSTQVNSGQIVSWSSGTVMRNFTSKTLDRTFEEIQFLGSITVK